MNGTGRRDALPPPVPLEVYQLLDSVLQQQIIDKNRDFMKGYRASDPYQEDFVSDQQQCLPQPPLVKDAMRPADSHIPLPLDFSGLDCKNDLYALFRDRKSQRVYTEQPVSLAQLSFLLWATQGIKELRGKAYATLRTVPSGGARHPFETYLAVRLVDGLRPGIYHYLPMEHALEFLGLPENFDEQIADSLSGQKWAAKANVVFYWSMVAYRAEWRYGIYAHRVALIDAGHLGQNLYLAAEGVGLGCCGIAAFEHELCCRMLEIDGIEEFPVYTMPVGTVSAENQQAEQDFYRFVREQNL